LIRYADCTTAEPSAGAPSTVAAEAEGTVDETSASPTAESDGATTVDPVWRVATFRTADPVATLEKQGLVEKVRRGRLGSGPSVYRVSPVSRSSGAPGDRS
jgi:hypothetical protein